MSKFKQILKELSGTALNVPTGELTALLEKAEDEIVVDDVAKVLKAKYRENLDAFGKNQKDEGFKAAERSTSKKFEDNLKTKFGITSAKQGDELIDEIQEAVKKAAPGKNSKDMTDDDIKKSDAFIKMENTYKAQLKTAQEDGEKKVNDLQTQYTKKENFTKLQSWGDKKLDELGFVFDEDPVRAKNQREDLIGKLADLESEWKGDDPILSKGGKLLENEFGHKVDPSDYLDKIASKYYAKKVADKRQMPPTGKDQKQQQGNGGDKKYTGVLPKSLSEYDSMMSNPDISLDDKLAINAHVEKNPVT